MPVIFPSGLGHLAWWHISGAWMALRPRAGEGGADAVGGWCHVSPSANRAPASPWGPHISRPSRPPYSSAKSSALQWRGPFGLENLWKDPCSPRLLVGVPGGNLLPGVASPACDRVLCLGCRQGLGLVCSLNCKVQEVMRQELWTLTSCTFPSNLQVCRLDVCNSLRPHRP